MLRTTLMLSGLLLLAAVSAGGGAFPYRHQVHTLDNGLKVILVPLPSNGLVAYYSVVRTGSRDEVEPGHSGFAHFFEHMMFRGTERYPGPVYDRLMTSMGADANAFTSDDVTCYHINLAREDLPKVIELEADRFQNLSYAEREFQTESGAVYGEYRKGRTSPFEVLDEALRDKAFDVHTYKHTVIGFEKDVAAMPSMYDYSKSFFRRFYRPENVVLLVTGDFDPGATLAMIKERYGAWTPGYQAAAVPAEPEQKGTRTLAVSYDGRTLPLVTLAWKGAAFDPGDREVVAGLLLGDLLFGETSELYRTLVLERHTVQRLMPDFGLNRDPGLWSVTAMVGAENDVASVRAEIEKAVAGLQEHEVAGDRLDDLKRRQRYGFLMGLQTPDRVASSLIPYVWLTGGIEAVDLFQATLATVTPADVQRAARRFLVPGHLTVAVLTGVGR